MQDFNALKRRIDWQKVGGLLPVIVQDFYSAEVLMLGFMDEKALEKSLEDKEVVFYSRTKKRLWKKGEESGNFLQIINLGLDCDSDTLLILAHPKGPTCHTGSSSCFEPCSSTLTFLSKLESLIASRKTTPPQSSYTASLFAQGTKRIAQKVGEEGVETALAAVAGGEEELLDEAADLLYHLCVLLASRSLSLNAVIARLKERHDGA
ncbi:bifunctional phosphoribosyl-AMP cyclohydrolase/phosphoribosyl-ATP diphosphatase HisIE [Campylobacter sp.]|uniref:bifunctional phosphoribosyl-AMP cyclohydrolase/phosphoribosyl-ATP diphosphatase HisIE n=1 Tax=Campylobacter sp. TaxID=205 RepID=UPI0026DCD703|nr:bifunctional phosphoribosyl-AMP cyclohydrolase/phosphoribosyl-ATP diphosphatase HisIE [Campylobacter sp.]MDO4674861.1 bifunctional phosphoribosyl-AMP cyclohydrolase/phosphoribosyl-ATP diphosphatase HisIE [Campylobacter sp.]